ncbi:XRE family transcriptional regulator [Georgenia sp. 10Sc9-8]|uniref:XRE family transcriptional regulator n=1 Tax=Georgenia halotolerans TaxID=3028317 RepID=A0ABT5TXZ9_9MICO|nr:XRE family transcriptional regulator [Georgenia halotolerans]
MSLGRQIRTVRAKRGLSVRALAARSEISPGFVSQLERDLANPSLETLRRIAVVLEVPLFNLFHDADSAVPAIVRRDARASVSSPSGGIRYSRLTPSSGPLEVLEGVLEPGASSSEEPRSHPSDECVVVLSGHLVIEVDGASCTLAEGDACSFDSRLPHRFRNGTGEPVRFLLSITPPSY